MIFRSVLICLLLWFDVRADVRSQRNPLDVEARYCDFDDARTNYNATDLLLCIDRLAGDLVDRESNRLTNEKGQWNGSTGRQISFADIFTSFLSDNPAVTQQSNPLPAYLTSGQHQSNYPASGATPGLSPGFQLNLFEALSSISRHDDYKCVPRILCEVASGKLPGRSLGKQWPSFFEFLGRNTITDWLIKFDVASASPLLNFGRAMFLGYSNRGNSAACYEAFPRCPRDMNALIYYLNNYNGGFFRLFNRIQAGKYRENGAVRDQAVDNYSKIVLKERILSAAKETRVEPVRNRIHFPSNKYHNYYEKQEFPIYQRYSNNNEITFPNQKILRSEPTRNNVPNYVPKLQSNHWIKDGITFFPRETADKRR